MASAFNSEPVLAVASYPDFVIRGTADLGSFGGGTVNNLPEIDVDAAERFFVLEMSAKSWKLDNVQMSHDGVNAAGNTFQFNLYKVASGTSISSGAVSANKVATQISITGTAAAAAQAFTLTTTTEGLLTFAAGDKLVMGVSSVSDQASTESYDSSSIDYIAVNWLGRTKIG